MCEGWEGGPTWAPFFLILGPLDGGGVHYVCSSRRVAGGDAGKGETEGKSDCVRRSWDSPSLFPPLASEQPCRHLAKKEAEAKHSGRLDIPAPPGPPPATAL